MGNLSSKQNKSIAPPPKEKVEPQSELSALDMARPVQRLYPPLPADDRRERFIRRIESIIRRVAPKYLHCLYQRYLDNLYRINPQLRNFSLDQELPKLCQSWQMRYLLANYRSGLFSVHPEMEQIMTTVLTDYCRNQITTELPAVGLADFQRAVDLDAFDRTYTYYDRPVIVLSKDAHTMVLQTLDGTYDEFVVPAYDENILRPTESNLLIRDVFIGGSVGGVYSVLSAENVDTFVRYCCRTARRKFAPSGIERVHLEYRGVGSVVLPGSGGLAIVTKESGSTCWLYSPFRPSRTDVCHDYRRALPSNVYNFVEDLFEWDKVLATDQLRVPNIDAATLAPIRLKMRDLVDYFIERSYPNPPLLWGKPNVISAIETVQLTVNGLKWDVLAQKIKPAQLREAIRDEQQFCGLAICGLTVQCVVANKTEERSASVRFEGNEEEKDVHAQVGVMALEI